jgi:N utilization substance protein B
MVSQQGEVRHRARERAFEVLYEQTMKDRTAEEIVSEVSSPLDAYTVELLNAVEVHGDWATELIATCSIDWTVDRMALLDRLIMTLALSESRLTAAPPRAVIIDEAVEFAKIFSTDASASFVNGLLSACFDSLPIEK